jgi:hypothetical protein
MSKWSTARKIQRAIVAARKRANVRWQRDRERREVLAAVDPVRFNVVKRIVVIDQETTAREIVFFDHDRYSDRKRKLRETGALAIP